MVDPRPSQKMKNRHFGILGQLTFGEDEGGGGRDCWHTKVMIN